jgi:hypothetical protein
MENIDNLIMKVDDIKRELLLLQTQWITLKDISTYKKEIKSLNHVIDEQDCEIRFLSKKLKKPCDSPGT